MMQLNNIGPILDSSLWMIVNSLWQFAIIAILCFVIQRYFVKSSSHRYLVGIISLVVMIIAAAATWIYYYDTSHTINSTTYYVTEISPQFSDFTVDIPWHKKVLNWIEENKFMIFASWLAGAAVLLSRIFLSLFWINILLRSSHAIENETISKSMARLQRFFNGKKLPKVRQSNLVHSPIIAGFIKPVILLPTAIANAISVKDAEAILAHEVAHFIRKDIWVNLLQHIMEMMFYYHPGVWWVSHQIRVERENCCDDIAVAFTGNNVDYAKALVNMHQLQINQPQATLAMYMAKDSNFSQRIKRILFMNANNLNIQNKTTSLIAILIAVVVGYSQLLAHDVINIVTNTNDGQKDELLVKSIPVDTIKQKQKFSVQRIDNGKSLKMSMEDGEITNLEVDGKTISPTEYDQYKSEIESIKPRSFGGDKGNGGFHMFFNDGDEWKSFSQDFKFPNMDSIMKESQIHMFDLQDRMKGLQDGFGFDFGNRFPQFWQDRNLDSLFANGNRFKHLDMDSLGKIFGDNFQFRFGDDADADDRAPFFFNMPEIEKEIEIKDGNRNYSDVLGNALNKDGLLIPGKENNVELTGKHLKINGEKQPDNIYFKYRSIFEDESGLTLDKKSRLTFKILGKESKRKYRVY